jgi:hypothetical protein
MTGPLAGTLLIALLAQPQADAPQVPPGKPPSSTNLVTLSGCVSQKPGRSGEFTFLDADSGSRYRLTGKSARKFAGQRVEIVGGPNRKRLTIRGGLLPSPNTAAQAGAIDPAKAARANLPDGAADSTVGSILPEFRVTALRAVRGGCL